MTASFSFSSASTLKSVAASILRTPAATALSERMRNEPISAVLETWVPPQNSLEKSPIETMRTVSPYFSSNSAIAPLFFASSMLRTSVVTGIALPIASLTSFSTCSICSGVRARLWVKSKRMRCSST